MLRLMFDASHPHQPHAFEDVANTERGLSWYYAAVAQEYASEQAVKAAQDWIEELQMSVLDFCKKTKESTSQGG